MNERLEQILLDFIAVYLHDRLRDRGKQPDDDYIREELSRLYCATDVNGTLLFEQMEYEEQLP